MKAESELWTHKPCWGLTALFFALSFIGITPGHVIALAELALNMAVNTMASKLGF